MIEHIVDGEAVAFHADAVDAGVGADPAGHLVERFAHIDFGIVEDLGTIFARERETGREMIDRDHAPGAEQQRRLDGEQPDRAAPPHRDRIAGFDRSEEHTSELQSLMRNSYAVLSLKKKTNTHR